MFRLTLLHAALLRAVLGFERVDVSSVRTSESSRGHAVLMRHSNAEAKHERRHRHEGDTRAMEVDASAGLSTLPAASWTTGQQPLGSQQQRQQEQPAYSTISTPPLQPVVMVPASSLPPQSPVLLSDVHMVQAQSNAAQSNAEQTYSVGADTTGHLAVVHPARVVAATPSSGNTATRHPTETLPAAGTNVVAPSTEPQSSLPSDATPVVVVQGTPVLNGSAPPSQALNPQHDNSSAEGANSTAVVVTDDLLTPRSAFVAIFIGGFISALMFVSLLSVLQIGRVARAKQSALDAVPTEEAS